MTKTKKLIAMIISVVMVCAMVFGMTACNKNNTNQTNNNNTNTNTNNNNNNTKKSAAEKYSEIKATWDNSDDEKTVSDKFDVTVKLPVGTGIYAKVEGTMNRSYVGEDITEVSGKIIKVSVTGAISTALGAVGNFVQGFDLNKLIKVSGKDEEGKYYEMENGNKLYYADLDGVALDPFYDDQGEEYDADAYKALEDAKAFNYHVLANANNEVILNGTERKPLAEGYLKVSNAGKFSVKGTVDLPFIQLDPEEEVKIEAIDMDTIKDLLEEFEVELDLDAFNLFDLSTGTVKEVSKTYTSTIVFATAMKSFLDQLDNLYDSFMAEDLDDTIYSVYKSFVKAPEQPIAKADMVEYMDSARAMINAFKKALSGKTLSAMLFNLVEMDDSDVTIVTNGKKINEIEQTQTGKLIITTALVDEVVGIINDQNLIEAANGDLMAWAPIASMDTLTVGSIYSLAKSILFKGGANKDSMIVEIEFHYTSEFDY